MARASDAEPGFAAELRRVRDAAGLTQEGLAHRSGLSVRAIRDLESGRVRQPRRASLALLADALGTDPKQLLQTLADSSSRPPTGPLPVPPLPSVGVVGRTDMLARVRAALTPGTRLCLCGPPGMGKSTVAAAVAHEARDRFDTVLWLDLRGFSRPRSTVDALRSLIGALDPLARPSSEDQRSLEVRWSAAVAGRSVLVVLDNAADEEAVRPLLPTGDDATVVVTARKPLMVVEPSRLFVLDALTARAGTELFRAWAGDGRTAANPAAVHAVVTACGGLPLAVQVAAARLASRPRWRVDDLAVRLQPDDQRLDQLRMGDLDVRASLESAYAGLTPTEQAALRALAALGTPEVPLWLAAAMFAQSTVRASARCDALTDAGLLYAHGRRGGRQGESFVLHDLVRIMAAEHAWADAHRAQTVAAVGRAARAVCELAAPVEQDLADQWATPGGPSWAASPYRIRPSAVGRSARARAAATRRFELDYGAISSVVETAVDTLDLTAAANVVQAVAAFRAAAGRFHDWIATHERMLSRPDIDRIDPLLRVCLLTSLGGGYLSHGDGARAVDAYAGGAAIAAEHDLVDAGRHARLGQQMAQAVPPFVRYDPTELEASVRADLAGAVAAGGRWSVSTAELTLVRLLSDTGRPQEAIDRITALQAEELPEWVQARFALRAADLYVERGYPGDLERASKQLAAARRYFIGRGLQVWIAATWHTQSKIDTRRGRHADALRALRQSEAAFVSTGDQRWASYVRTSAARSHLALGNPVAARAALDGAEGVLRLLEDQHGLDLVADTAADPRMQPVWAG